MATINLHRVNTLPTPLVPSTVYYVKSTDANLAELVLVGNTISDVRHIINKDDINTLIGSQLNLLNTVEVYADINARDAVTLDANKLAVVLDASDDTTVSSGAATYLYDYNNTNWVKLSEFESLDLVFNWANLQDKPTSTVVDIDAAVTAKHSHANKTILDNVAENNGFLEYNGVTLDGTIPLVGAEW